MLQHPWKITSNVWGDSTKTVFKHTGLHFCGGVNRQVFSVFIDFSQWLLIDDRKHFPEDRLDSFDFKRWVCNSGEGRGGEEQQWKENVLCF